MENTNNLISMGFILNDESLYEFKGTHQTFVASVSEHGTRSEYVNLAKYHPDVDQRPLSKRRGKRFISQIKNCCSPGSIERALDKYDVPEERYSYMIGGCFLTDQLAISTHLTNPL